LFKYEFELVNAFKEQSGDFLKSFSINSKQKTFYIQEFNSNFGIADIVLGTFRSSKSTNIRKPINLNWLYPLSTLKRSTCLSLDEFQGTFGFSKISALKRIKEYERAGFVIRGNSGQIKVLKEYKFVTNLVISIEAKLRDWRKALFQAKRYQRFSDFSFVLLDARMKRNALKNINVFIDQNIGLLSLNANSIEVHLVPQKNKKKISDYYLRLNEKVYHHITLGNL